MYDRVTLYICSVIRRETDRFRVIGICINTKKRKFKKKNGKREKEILFKSLSNFFSFVPFDIVLVLHVC